MTEQLGDLLNEEELDFLNNLLDEETDDNESMDFAIPPMTAFQDDVMNHVGMSNSPRSPVPSGSISKKCREIYIGGVSVEPGITIFPDEPHFCSNLSCVSCDHIVLRFPNSRWAEETDYLFLRNNYPNRVDGNLIVAPGWCAFCCQCTFKAEKKLQRLSPFSSNWVCRGHY